MPAPRDDRFFDGGGHETTAGYARAARRGNSIVVSGTTANDGRGGALHVGDTGAQTAAALRQALSAIEQLGGRIDDVVRTRIFLTPSADWIAASRAHAVVLGGVEPANTLVFVHALVGDDFLVEVEIDAVVEAPDEGVPENLRNRHERPSASASLRGERREGAASCGLRGRGTQ